MFATIDRHTHIRNTYPSPNYRYNNTNWFDPYDHSHSKHILGPTEWQILQNIRVPSKRTQIDGIIEPILWQPYAIMHNMHNMQTEKQTHKQTYT